MKDKLLLQPLRHSIYWWVHILIGIFSIILAFLFAFTPLTTYVSISVIFSIIIIITGFFEFINTLKIRKGSKKWLLYLTGAVIDIFFGLTLLVYEGFTKEVLPHYIGIWFIIRSILFYIIYRELRHLHIRNRRWFLATAEFTFIFGAAITASPLLEEENFNVVYLFSLAFLAMGLYRLTLGYDLYQAK